jgi:hypothetical protein
VIFQRLKIIFVQLARARRPASAARITVEAMRLRSYITELKSITMNALAAPAGKAPAARFFLLAFGSECDGRHSGRRWMLLTCG